MTRRLRPRQGHPRRRRLQAAAPLNEEERNKVVKLARLFIGDYITASFHVSIMT